MILIITFLTGFFINDSRLMYKVFGIRMEYIKYRLILNELGILALIFCLVLNYLKGYLIINNFNQGELSVVLLSFILLCGNYLGARPSRTGGSELIILCGALSGFNYEIIQIPIAIFLGGFLLIKRIKKSFWIASFFCLSSLFIYKYYYLFLLLFLVLLYFLNEGHSQLLSIFNSIKRRFSIVETKG